MSGTRAGALKAHKTTLERHGKDFYNLIGSKGGRNTQRTPHGFATDKHMAVAAGAKGGSVSKRGAYMQPAERKEWLEYCELNGKISQKQWRKLDGRKISSQR